MDGPDPLCLFTGRVEERADAYVLEIPKRDVELGTIHPDALYRVGLYPGVTTGYDSETRTGMDAVDSNTTNSLAGTTRGVANGDGDGDGEATGAAPPSPGPETASADGRDRGRGRRRGRRRGPASHRVDRPGGGGLRNLRPGTTRTVLDTVLHGGSIGASSTGSTGRPPIRFDPTRPDLT
jgi:hypothetical protein